MLPIKIDTSELMGGYNLSRESMDKFNNALVKRVAGRFIEDVKIEVKNALSSTRAEYLNNIRASMVSNSAVEVELLGVLPNMIEQGASAFDMKTGFKRSDKAIQKLDGGWYITIPLGHATPSALGEASTLGAPMPTVVYEVAKKLGKGEVLTAEKMKFNTGSFDNYVGMRRSAKKGHTGYVTFRRVSDKSEKESWMHTGFEARNFFDKGMNNENILQEIDMVRDEFISQLGL